MQIDAYFILGTLPTYEYYLPLGHLPTVYLKVF